MLLLLLLLFVVAFDKIVPPLKLMLGFWWRWQLLNAIVVIGIWTMTTTTTEKKKTVFRNLHPPHLEQLSFVRIWMKISKPRKVVISIFGAEQNIIGKKLNHGGGGDIWHWDMQIHAKQGSFVCNECVCVCTRKWFSVYIRCCRRRLHSKVLLSPQHVWVLLPPCILVSSSFRSLEHDNDPLSVVHIIKNNYIDNLKLSTLLEVAWKEKNSSSRIAGDI